MHLLYRVIYAAHASGTHHKLALEGLCLLTVPERELWQRMFLKHAKLYLTGSKAPDVEFKDFKNHVLHVRDGFWGGAPEKARAWYEHLVEALQGQDWPTAVWCAGVLSHYVTDPVHPFHTAQSEAENNIHRAVEWSISKSFDTLKRIADTELAAPRVRLGDGDRWLEVALCEAATHANGYYEKLIAHYDINRGVVDPPAGLDSVAQRIAAELIAHASALHGAILERALVASRTAPPDVPLTLDTVLATLQIPIKWLTRKLADREEQKLVERMYDELKASGTVEASLPEDDRTVRDLYNREVLSRRRPADVTARFVGEPPPRVETVLAWKARHLAAAELAAERAAPSADAPSPAPARTAVAPVAAPPPVPAVVPAAEVPAVAPIAAEAEPASVVELRPGSLGHRLATTPPRAPAPRRATGPRVHLATGDDLVDAPSIGPKMAERFAALGIRTVGEFLAADPAGMAARLGVRQVTADTLVDWQHQARLVMTVPGLRGTHAQLLVGAGFRQAGEIADAEPDMLCQRVLAFAITAEGMRVLRNGDPPDIERIKGWLEAAREARAA